MCSRMLFNMDLSSAVIFITSAPYYIVFKTTCKLFFSDLVKNRKKPELCLQKTPRGMLLVNSKTRIYVWIFCTFGVVGDKDFMYNEI